MRKITELVTHGKSFIICKDDSGFWGIDGALIVDGKLTRRVNGIEGHLSETLQDCLNACHIEAHIEELKAQGYTFMQAMNEAWLELYGYTPEEYFKS